MSKFENPKYSPEPRRRRPGRVIGILGAAAVAGITLASCTSAAQQSISYGASPTHAFIYSGDTAADGKAILFNCTPASSGVEDPGQGFNGQFTLAQDTAASYALGGSCVKRTAMSNIEKAKGEKPVKGDIFSQASASGKYSWVSDCYGAASAPAKTGMTVVVSQPMPRSTLDKLAQDANSDAGRTADLQRATLKDFGLTSVFAQNGFNFSEVTGVYIEYPADYPDKNNTTESVDDDSLATFALGVGINEDRNNLTLNPELSSSEVELALYVNQGGTLPNASPQACSTLNVQSTHGPY